MIDIFAWGARGPEINLGGPTKTLQTLMEFITTPDLLLESTLESK